MDDKTLDNKIAVATAFASIDFTQCRTTADAEAAVLRRLDLASRMLSDDSIAMRMCDAARITATIQSIELEESSKRYLVKFVADKSTDGKVETIRTDRTDGRSGDLVRAMWSQELVGKHVLLYKNNEMPTNDQAAEIRKSGRSVPPQGYRCAVYVKRLPH